MAGRTQEIAQELSKDWRVLVYIVMLIAAIVSLIYFGLQFGMDFKGGTMLQLRLDEPVDAQTMGTIVSVLSDRLNSFGLKDISVKPFGNEYLLVEISASDPGTVEQLKNLISQQGSFQAIIDGEIVLYSEDITGVKTNPQEGYGYMTSTEKWQVPFMLSKDGSERFAEQAKGRCNDTDCERIYMFIDRPENAAVVIPTSLYDSESEMLIDPTNPGSYPVAIDEFERNSLTAIIVADNITDEVRASLANYSKVIVPSGTYDNASLQGLNVAEKPKGKDYWLWTATGLKSILFLTPGVTSGEPIREATITGGASDIEEAVTDMTEMVVILRSGRLPVGLSIASTSSVSPTLGANFLNDSLMIGIVAIFGVGLVIVLRYRNPKIAALMMMGNVSEVLIILGTLALIRNQLDIAAIAGIIATVGGGVNQFIVIVDEVRQKAPAEDAEESVIARIKKAFRIIMGSAATTVAAMIPLMTLGLGVLKGFAITTLIGIIVGVIIVRPVFGKVIEKLEKRL